MKPWIVVAVFSLLLAGCASQGDELPASPPQNQKATSSEATPYSDEDQSAQFRPSTNDEWVSYYYYHQNEAGLKTVFKDLMTSKEIQRQDEKILVTKYAYTGFLTGLFLKNPQKVDTWLTGPKFQGEAGLIMAGALLMAGMPEKIGMYTDVPPPPASEKTGMTLLQMPMEHPFMPLLLVYAFSGSGDRAYIDRMIDGLAGKIALGNGEKQRSEMKRYLTYYLMRARYDHVQVDEIISQREKEGLDFSVALEDLKKMKAPEIQQVSMIENKMREGLSAQFFVIDSAQMTANSTGKKVTSATTLNSGQEFGLALSFQGMGLDSAGMASVVYDFKITNAAGEDVPQMQDKNVLGMRAKTPVRFLPFTPRIIPILRFAESVPSGTYTIVVNVQDMNTGQKRTLSQKIKLNSKGVVSPTS